MSTYHLIHDITPSDGSWKLCSTRDLAAFSGLTTIRRILHAGWSVLLIFTCHLLKTFWSIQATILSILGESRYHTKLCWTLEQLHLFPINRCSLLGSLSFTFPARGNLLFGTKPLKFVHILNSSLVFVISLWLQWLREKWVEIEHIWDPNYWLKVKFNQTFAISLKSKASPKILAYEQAFHGRGLFSMSLEHLRLSTKIRLLTTQCNISI